MESKVLMSDIVIMTLAICCGVGMLFAFIVMIIAISQSYEEEFTMAEALKQDQDKLWSTDGIGCPNCGCISNRPETLISTTEQDFVADPNPHMEWEEEHKCQRCETIYWLRNST